MKMEAPGCFREDENESSQAISWLKVEWWNPEIEKRKTTEQAPPYFPREKQKRSHNFLQLCFPQHKMTWKNCEIKN
jgi:hypothetical protein